MTIAQLERALEMGQPASLERLAYWLDLDCLPSDRDAFLVLRDLVLWGHL